MHISGRDARNSAISGEIAYMKNLHVDGNAPLDWLADLTTLPDGLTVDGILDLRGCANLTKLGTRTTVGHYIDLSGCSSLKELPDYLSFRGIHLYGCPARYQMETRLPDGVTFRDYLRTDVTKLLTDRGGSMTDLIESKTFDRREADLGPLMLAFGARNPLEVPESYRQAAERFFRLWLPGLISTAEVEAALNQ